MKKLALTSLSLFVAHSALAQEPPPDPGPPGDDAYTTAPIEAAPPEAAAVPEESFDPSLLAAAGGGEGTLSAEELEKLGFGGGSPAVDTDLKIYGFADVNFSFFPTPKSDPYRRSVQPHSQFFVGNINLFLSKNLSESVRMMTEVRFHYSPHGSKDRSDNINFIENAYGDPADANRPVHMGGVEIERVYVEWAMFAQLSVRIGQFLTPYGIWNVDHGSPVFIPCVRPFVIGSQLFPERQTGFEFLGKTDLSTNNTIGYHATLSNGLGPVSELVDMDENKGVGGRLFWENRTLGTLRLGGSIFYAKDTTAVYSQSLGSDEIVTTESITSQSKVLAMAADLQWRYAGWHVQAEVITQQRAYTDGNRYAGTNPFTGQPLFPSNFTSWGAYGLLGYGFDVRGVNLMPWFMLNSFDQVQPRANILTKTINVSPGFNVRPIDSLVIKVNYNYSGWPSGSVISDKPVHLIQSQVAWAF